MTITLQFSDMASQSRFLIFLLSSFSCHAVFVLSSLVIGSSFMSISLLFLELCQFFFIRDRPEIRKLKIALSAFCPISGEWDKLGKQGEGGGVKFPSPRLGLTTLALWLSVISEILQQKPGIQSNIVFELTIFGLFEKKSQQFKFFWSQLAI